MKKQSLSCKVYIPIEKKEVLWIEVKDGKINSLLPNAEAEILIDKILKNISRELSEQKGE